MGIDSLPRFIADHLHRIAKEEGFVDGYDVKHECGSKPGDGYNAEMLSIKLVGNRRTQSNGAFEQEELAMIFKLQPGSSDRQATCGSAFVFRQEVQMYGVILPALVAFQSEHGVAEDISFTGFPKCYGAFHVEGSSESMIIMEDLRASGYEMWPKHKSTDFESVRRVMEQIGRLHGLSIAIRDQKPEVFETFQALPPIIIDFYESPGISLFIQSCLKQTLSLMDTAQDVADCERFVRDFREIYMSGLDVELLGNHGVMSHGDSWLNNLMFKMDKVSTIRKLTDFSISRLIYNTFRIPRNP